MRDRKRTTANLFSNLHPYFTYARPALSIPQVGCPPPAIIVFLLHTALEYNLDMLAHVLLPLSLFVSLLLAAPSTPDSRSPSTLFHKRYMLQCFTHTAGISPFPTNTHDCLDAVTAWQCHSRVQLGLTTYSRQAANGNIQLPVNFKSGTCVFGIDLRRRTPAVMVSRSDILERAQELIISCVTPPIGNAFGGTVTVGPDDLLELKVWGQRTAPRPLFFEHGTCGGGW